MSCMEKATNLTKLCHGVALWDASKLLKTCMEPTITSDENYFQGVTMISFKKNVLGTSLLI
jgi:hypothetical protein